MPHTTENATSTAAQLLTALHAVPAPLLASPRWVPVRGLHPDFSEGYDEHHTDKTPLWRWTERQGSVEQAAAAAPANGGLAYVLTPDSPVTIIDLDQVACPNGRGYHVEVRGLLDAALAGGHYIERSASGRGLHLIVNKLTDAPLSGTRYLGACDCGADHTAIVRVKNKKGEIVNKLKSAHVEWWSGEAFRYVWVTGRHADFCTQLLDAPASINEQLTLWGRREVTLESASTDAPLPEPLDFDVLDVVRSSVLRVFGASPLSTVVCTAVDAPVDDIERAHRLAFEDNSARVAARLARGENCDESMSAYLSSVITRLFQSQQLELSQRDVFSLVTSSSVLWSICLRKRHDDTQRAMLFAWQEVQRIAARAQSMVQRRVEQRLQAQRDAVEAMAMLAPQATAAAQPVAASSNSASNVVSLDAARSAAVSSGVIAPPNFAPPTDIDAPVASAPLVRLDDVIFVADKAGYFTSRKAPTVNWAMATLLPQLGGGFDRAGVLAMVTNKIIPTVDRVQMLPTEPPHTICTNPISGERVFNSYTGYHVAPYTGADAGTEASVQPFLDLLAEIIPHPVQRDYWLNWCSWVIQNPAGHMNQHPVLLGTKGGEGKNFLGNILAGILGSSIARPINMGNVMNTEFTHWRRDLHLGLLTEGARPPRGYHRGDVVDRLKQLADGSEDGFYFHIEKGKNGCFAVDNLNLIIMSNHPETLPMDGTDRKFYPIETQHDLSQDGSVEEIIHRRSRKLEAFAREWLDSPVWCGKARLRAFFDRRDLAAQGFSATGWTPTEGILEELREQSLSALDVAANTIRARFEAMDEPMVLDARTVLELVRAQAQAQGMSATDAAHIKQVTAVRKWARGSKLKPLRVNGGDALVVTRGNFLLPGYGSFPSQLYTGVTRLPRDVEVLLRQHCVRGVVAAQAVITELRGQMTGGIF